MAKSRERVKSYMTKRIAYWSNLLWLNSWAITAELKERDEHDDGVQAFGAGASADYESRYQHGHITLYYDRLKNQNWRELDRIASHEVSHLLLAEIDSFMDDIREELPEFQKNFVGNRWGEVREAFTSHMERILRDVRKKIGD
mgnify:CR=1 FL=1